MCCRSIPFTCFSRRYFFEKIALYIRFIICDFFSVQDLRTNSLSSNKVLFGLSRKGSVITNLALARKSLLQRVKVANLNLLVAEGLDSCSSVADVGMLSSDLERRLSEPERISAAPQTLSSDSLCNEATAAQLPSFAAALIDADVSALDEI